MKKILMVVKLKRYQHKRANRVCNAVFFDGHGLTKPFI